MEQEADHIIARWALEGALRSGDTSMGGLLEGLLRCAHERTGIMHRLSPLVTLFEHDGPRDREKLGCEYILHTGTGPDGLYVLKAEWPEDNAEVFVQAAFAPANARTADDIETLLDFALTRTRVGCDLLAACYRGPGPDCPEESWIPIGPEIDRLLRSNISLAHEAIKNHAAGQRAGPVTPAMDLDPDILAQVAVRQYPEKPLLATEGAEFETWVAVIPGRGHMLVYPIPNPFPRFLALDGSFDQGWEEWVDRNTMFRPSDEDRDPGLEGRIRAAIAAEAAAAPPDDWAGVGF